MQFHQRESGICSHPSQNSNSGSRRVEQTKRPTVKLQKYTLEYIWGSNKRHFHLRGVENIEYAFLPRREQETSMYFYRRETGIRSRPPQNNAFRIIGVEKMGRHAVLQQREQLLSENCRFCRGHSKILHRILAPKGHLIYPPPP